LQASSSIGRIGLESLAFATLAESVLGQKQTETTQLGMSTLPPKADINQGSR